MPLVTPKYPKATANILLIIMNFYMLVIIHVVCIATVTVLHHKVPAGWRSVSQDLDKCKVYKYILYSKTHHLGKFLSSQTLTTYSAKFPVKVCSQNSSQHLLIKTCFALNQLQNINARRKLLSTADILI